MALPTSERRLLWYRDWWYCRPVSVPVVQGLVSLPTSERTVVQGLVGLPTSERTVV